MMSHRSINVAALSLKENFSWTFGGNVLYSLSQWGIVTLLARFASTGEVGLFALALAIVAPVYQLLNLQLRGVQATDVRRTFRFADYFTLRLMTSAFAVVIVVFICLARGYNFEESWVIIVVALAKGIDALSDAFYGHFQRIEKMDFIAKAMAAKGMLALALFLLGLITFDSLQVAICGYAAGSLIPFIVYVAPTGLATLDKELAEPWVNKLLSLRFDKIVRLAFVAFPLGIVMLLVALATNIPLYVLEGTHGKDHLGIYAAITYLIFAGTTVVGALGQAVTPRLATLYAAGNLAEFRRMLIKMMLGGAALGVVGAIAAAVAGSPILSILYGEEYARYDNVLVILAIGASFTFAASFAGYGLTAMRVFQPQVPLFLLVVIVAGVSAWLAIPQLGIVGAGWVVVVTSLGQWLASLGILTWKMGHNREVAANA